jgi:hypothetical protein
MRARDARAIAFCVATTLAVLFVAYVLFGSDLVALALAAAWAIWLITRPRMQRVIRRLRRQPDWSGYFRDD